MTLDWSQARGPTKARYLAQTLYRGEDYWLSIDSHTRFVKNWDQILIDMLASCPSEKSIITGYPSGYELLNKISDEKFPPFLCAKEFNNVDQMIRFHGKQLSQGFTKPQVSYFWVAGLSFCEGRVITEVGYDPHTPFLFFGEESSMSVRLWTHGWDFYAPHRHVVYHLWDRNYRSTFTSEVEDKENMKEQSLERVKLILGMITHHQISHPDALIEIDKYSLGGERSLEEYQNFCGVDFKKQKIEERAKLGGLHKKYFMDSIMDLIFLMASSPNPSPNPSPYCPG
eukprot:CAMPEP_0174279720 /NCGR_PEP_ID=MMETSP0439-20130205/62187_1 /TAXON_ID=0 /ORGANISM="Stereomyxa ramosa, Strain Chinc5" /LENGTH=283 /DNA_ID=CAMNT_0015372269 /DNA_START=682 /DNA_END=1533 /DNA_ORIENTATION=-